ncbi:hypothetical protein [Hazenella coriacea]|uniref:Uncharacterized protein n=1 Tax=Hazenella coriacea TaxID=1179467 RepID=A0A4R3LBV2_9BACL|nr:hypothetical protein [Hazenella coriacea]TCS94996.1 hypothetical protein EDD58_103421 [Hazenella coriacea]
MEVKKRGGKRPGAGRPRLGITKKVSLTLTLEEWEKLEESGDKIGHWVKKKLNEEEQTVKGNSVVSSSLYQGLYMSIENFKHRTLTGSEFIKEYNELKEAISFYEKNYGVSANSLWTILREIHSPEMSDLNQEVL